MAVLLLSTTILTLALAAWLYGRNERARAEAKAAQAALEKAEARIEQLEEKLDTAYETIASMRRDGFVAPPRPNPNNTPENLPADVSEILSKYPPELRGPTLQWIKEQRRAGASWDRIKMHITGRVQDNTP